MSRKLIETCDHCGKEEEYYLQPYEIMVLGEMSIWLPHNGSRYLLCDECGADLSKRQSGAKEVEALKQIRLDFISECQNNIC